MAAATRNRARGGARDRRVEGNCADCVLWLLSARVSCSGAREVVAVRSLVRSYYVCVRVWWVRFRLREKRGHSELEYVPEGREPQHIYNAL